MSMQGKDLKGFYDSVSMENEKGICTYAGVIEGLKKLKSSDIRLSIVTSKNEKRTKSIVNNLFHEIDFDIIVTPESVKEGRGKPNPDQILYACLNLGVDPYNSLYVGDMEVDRLSADRAGCHFVHANWGYGDISTITDVWFNTIEDLVNFILE